MIKIGTCIRLTLSSFNNFLINFAKLIRINDKWEGRRRITNRMGGPTSACKLVKVLTWINRKIHCF